jgi:hypothetical protein
MINRFLRLVVASAFSLILSGFTAFGSSANAQQVEVWVDFEVHGNIVYLLRQSPKQIMRFDLGSESWLSPLDLSDFPNAFTFSDSLIFVAYENEVVALPINGGPELNVHDSLYTITDLVVDDNNLIISQLESDLRWFEDLRLTTVDVNTFSQLDELTHNHYSMQKLSLAPSINKVFGAYRYSIHSAAVVMANYDDSGMFGTVSAGSSAGSYVLDEERAWVFADETRVLDDAGNVYSAGDVSYRTSFGVEVAGVSFHGPDIPIVLTKGDELVSLSNALTETGRTSVQEGAKDIALGDNKVFVFREDGAQPTEVGVQIVPLSAISPEEPDQPISPVGLTYVVQDSVVDSRGIAYIISRSHPVIFRYDLTEQAYIENVSLPALADRVEYHPDQDRIYLYSAGRQVYRVDDLAESPSVGQFPNVLLDVYDLEPIGEDLLLDHTPPTGGFGIYDSDGVLLNQHPDCCYQRPFLYDYLTERLFWPGGWVQYLGDGQLGESVDGPWVIAISNTGELAVDDDGYIYNAANLSVVDSLAEKITHAAWMENSRLYTIKYRDSSSIESVTIQRWNEYFSQADERTFVGSLAGFHDWSDHLLLIRSVDGTPRFELLDPALNEVPPPTLATPDIRLEDSSAFFAALSWNDITGEREYVVERKRSGEASWSKVETLDANQAYFVDTTLSPENVYQFRVSARNGSVVSDFSAIVEVDLEGVVDHRIDPSSVEFIADDVSLGANGLVYVLSLEYESIFVWNTTSQDWGVTIPLQGTPDYVAYSPGLPFAFTGYLDGSINRIDLKLANPVEVPFAELPDSFDLECGMEATGAFLVVCVDSQNTDSFGYEHRSYNMSGVLIDAEEERRSLYGAAWSEANRTLYYFKSSGLQYALSSRINVDGTFGHQLSSFPDYFDALDHPIRVAPDGSVVVFGSGDVFDGIKLERIYILPGSIEDGMWLQGEFFTLSSGEVRRHLADYSVGESMNLGQTVLRILPVSEDLFVVVTQTDDQDTRLQVFDVAFSEIPAPIFWDRFE